MNDPFQVADHIAKQDDRYLVILLIVLIVLAGIAIWRFMASDREKISKRLTEITDRHIQSQEKLSEVVTNNTHALREVKDMMATCRNNNQPQRL